MTDPRRSDAGPQRRAAQPDVPLISFVIPILNEEAGIGTLLTDLRVRYPECERVVVDGGSRDDSVREAMPLCDQLLIGEPGRDRQMNLGARAARGHYLFFLHADTRPTIEWQALTQQLANTPPWGFCAVKLSGDARVFRVIEWFISRRSALTGVGTGDQMLFAQRDLFMRSGGFPEQPLMEDIAFSKRLLATSRPLVIKTPVVTSSRRWETQGVVRTVLRMWTLRLAYYAGVSPDRLQRHYDAARKAPQSGQSNPF